MYSKAFDSLAGNMCHYYGDMFGGGDLPILEGTWQVYHKSVKLGVVDIKKVSVETEAREWGYQYTCDLVEEPSEEEPEGS